MIGLSKGNGGYPWHGLWRRSTAKITTPAGQVIDAPFDPYLIESGECWMVKIDGLPEVATTADEANQGKTWLNYALLCGRGRALYGKSLGDNGSIYIDGHGQPWLMRCNVAGSRTVGLIEATVSLRRFGVAGPVATQHNYATVSAGFQTAPAYPYPNSAGGWGVHLDMSRDGRRHLIAVLRDGSPVPNDWLGYACIALLTVSGSPDDGDVDISISIISDETAENWDSAAVWSGAGGAYPYWDTTTDINGVSYGSKDESGGRFYYERGGLPGPVELNASRTIIAGARFKPTGEPEVVMFRAAYKRQVILDSETVGHLSYTQVGRDIESVLMRLEIGQNTVSESGLTRSTGFTQTRAYPSVANYSAVESTDEGGAVFTRSYNSPNSVMSATGHNGFFGFELASPGQLEKYGRGLRLSNTVYGLRSWGYSATTLEISSTRFIFGPAVGVIGQDPTIVAVDAAMYSSHPDYASEHPVTGDVVRSTRPVCWV